MTSFDALRHKSLDPMIEDHQASLPKWLARTQSPWGRLFARWPLTFFLVKMAPLGAIGFGLSVGLTWLAAFFFLSGSEVNIGIIVAPVFAFFLLGTWAHAFYLYSAESITGATRKTPYSPLDPVTKRWAMQWVVYGMKYLDDPLLMQRYESLLENEEGPMGWWLDLAVRIEAFDKEFQAALATHRAAERESLRGVSPGGDIT